MVSNFYWCIYYGDNSTFSSVDGTVVNAPARNVQAIVQDHPQVGWEVTTGKDYYVWTHAGWWGVDLFGLWDYLVELGWKKVLFGRTLTTEEYNMFFQRALADAEERKCAKGGCTARECN